MTSDGRRAVCARCRRPVSVCYCAHIPHLPTRTRVLLLQHPRERHVAIGTARMAHLALPSSTFRVGVDFSRDAVVKELLSPAAGAPAYVLFPSPGAIEVSELPRESPITLVVLDGTWSLARKLLHLNPFLQALPHVAFTPGRPSDYRIRRQPAPFCVSTIEALTEVLGILEPGPTGFARLLDPFRAMVARQEQFIEDVHTRRHFDTRRKLRARAKPTLAERLRADWPRIVCVQGEANAWPRRHPERQEPELIHWVAHRPASGDKYQAVVAPRREMAPSTLRYSEIPGSALAQAVSLDEWRQSWTGFSRPDDVVVSWGGFYAGLARQDGLLLPESRIIDLRTEVAQLRRGRFKTIDDALSAWATRAPSPLDRAPGASEGAAPSRMPPAAALGRAGRRLAALVELLGHLASSAPATSPQPGPASTAAAW
jgi:DTW domain-containing protein YfiP